MSGAMEELAARQMRGKQRDVDACAAQAAAQGSAGALTMVLEIDEGRVSALRTVNDSVKSAALETCLQGAAKTWRFTLAHVHFDWSVMVMPAQAKVRPAEPAPKP
jgi:hypothetical protein